MVAAAMTVERRSAGPVTEDEAGTRLDRWLAAKLAGLSRARIAALIKDGKATGADGAAVDATNYRVQEGERFTLTVPPAESAVPQPEDIPLTIVFEDRDVIVVDKPAGLVVHPAAGNHAGTLVNALLRHCGDSLSGIGGVRRPGIVHRLDKDTSGLMVVAKNDAAHQALVAGFATRAIKRTYQALVWGVPEPEAGRIEGAIGRSARDRKKMAVVARGGRAAATNYRVLETFGADAKGRGALALVECSLESGRTHQIRVHMSHLGHPVVGDPSYGKPPAATMKALPLAVRQAVTNLSRQFLHAAALEFVHPRTGKARRFVSRLPLELGAIVSIYRTDIRKDAQQGRR